MGKNTQKAKPLVIFHPHPEHMSSSAVLIESRVARSTVSCFVDHYLSFCLFCFDHCIVCPSHYLFRINFFVENCTNFNNEFLIQFTY